MPEVQTANFSMIPSGPVEPTVEEVVLNAKDYEFKINQMYIIPNVEVWKDGKLVKCIDEARMLKLSGTLNTAYAQAFIADLINDTKIGLYNAVNQSRARARTQAAQEGPNDNK